MVHSTISERLADGSDVESIVTGQNDPGPIGDHPKETAETLKLYPTQKAITASRFETERELFAWPVYFTPWTFPVMSGWRVIRGSSISSS